MSTPKQRNPLFGVDAQKVREVSCRVRAQLALGDDPRYRWLCDRTLIEGGRPQSWRPRLLSELGRLAEEQGKETMRTVAAQLCEVEPATDEGLRIIRQQRVQGGASLAAPLTAAIIKLVESFRKERPELSKPSILTALGDALTQLADED